MFKVPLIELFLIGIPSEVLVICFCYILSKTKFNLKRITISVVTMCISIYCIRMLPIHFNSISIINLSLLIIVNIFINKISIIKSIIVSICDSVIGIFCEAITFVILQNVFNISTDFILNTTTFNKIVYGSYPSLIMYLLITILINFIIKKELQKKTYQIKNMFYLNDKDD